MFLSLCLLSFSGRMSLTFPLVFDKKSKGHLPLLCSITHPFRLPILWCHWPTRLSDVQLMMNKEVLCLISAVEHKYSTGPFLDRNAFDHLYDYTASTLRAFFLFYFLLGTQMIQARDDSFACSWSGTRTQTAGHMDQLIWTSMHN